MHFRNRVGYRGMGGVAPSSRISPESSMRGGGVYSNEFRSNSRGGFSRSQSRQFGRQSPAPPVPPQKGGSNGGGGADVFMEAGKLAAEYLIAKGLLPADALSGKWQNGTVKNNDMGSARASVLSRLGEVVSDSGPTRRRYGDEYSYSVWSRSLNGRKRNGSFKNYGSESSREMGRSGAWSERSRVDFAEGDDGSEPSREMGRSGSWSERSRVGFAEGDDDSDRASQNSASNVVGGQESDIVVDPRSRSSKRPRLVEDVGAKNDAAPSKKDSVQEAVEKDDKEAYQNAGKKEEMQVQDSKDDIAVIASSDEGSLARENRSDLLSFCRFVNIPTRTRSSMSVRGSRIDTDPMNVDEDAQKGEGKPSKEYIADVEEFTASTLSTNGLPHQMNDSKVVNLDRQKEPASEKELVAGSNTILTSSLDQNSVKDPKLPDFEMITVMTKEHSEKRALDKKNTCLGNKRPRESDPSEDTDPNPVFKRPVTEELMTYEDWPINFPSDEKRLLDVSLYPKVEIEAGMEFAEEKQISAGSFKTCDLNLMEAAESNETHGIFSDFLFSSVRENGKQPITVNVDLSMNTNSSAPNIYGKCSVDDKDIEVIDLENDSILDHRGLTNSDGRAENAFNGLGSLPSTAPNATEILDSSDGFKLMITELVENDLPNCSSATAAVNGLQNNMDLDNDQEILGDEDPIYMSLGEIPSSILRAWEQPNQEYGKPF